MSHDLCEKMIEMIDVVRLSCIQNTTIGWDHYRQYFGSCFSGCASKGLPIDIQNQFHIPIDIQITLCFFVGEIKQCQKGLLSVGSCVTKDALVIALAIHPLEAVVGMVKCR